MKKYDSFMEVFDADGVNDSNKYCYIDDVSIDVIDNNYRGKDDLIIRAKYMYKIAFKFINAFCIDAEKVSIKFNGESDSIELRNDNGNFIRIFMDIDFVNIDAVYVDNGDFKFNSDKPIKIENIDADMLRDNIGINDAINRYKLKY